MARQAPRHGRGIRVSPARVQRHADYLFRSLPSVSSCFGVKLDEGFGLVFLSGRHSDEQPTILMESFTSRWIISVLDTVSDYAPSARSCQSRALKNFFLGIRYGWSLFQRAGFGANRANL